MICAEVVIPDGNSIEVRVEWVDMDGNPAVPTAVHYRVYDRDGDPVSNLQPVPSPAATMEFVIPGSDLPGNSMSLRPLDIQIRGAFGTDVHTEILRIRVRRIHPY